MNKVEQILSENHGLYTSYSVRNMDGEFESVVSVKSAAGITENIAVEFAEWVGFSGWNFNASKKCWWNISSNDFFPTTEELLQEFIKTKQ